MTRAAARRSAFQVTEKGSLTAMPKARRDLGLTRSVSAEALGQPGQRTFRVVILAEGGEATVWLEKEHMAALAMSIQAVLQEATGDGAATEDEAAAGTEKSQPAAKGPPEFKAIALTITYDSARGRFGVLAYDDDDAETDTATLAWWLTRDQAEGLAEDAAAIVMSGRPICPLCHRPKDPAGHVCTQTNGHQSAKDHF